ncbi:MAG: 4'-phosphopantetheinyl transferase superfamily protein [bacterium]|nr:4'-phosphopantetheinyl transferase superfamily protein [bacterium]
MIDVFTVEVPDKLEACVYETLLTHVEPWKKHEIQRFAREDLRLRALFSDLLIRYVIIRETGMLNREIEFFKDAYGKPFLEKRHDVHFNISHSGRFVAAALDSRPVGIDVEEISEIDLNICSQFYSREECDDLMNMSDREAYFFTLWTLKESFIKFYGTGLWLPLNAFTIKYLGRDRIAMLVEGKPVGVFFRQYDLHKKYKMAVCSDHGGFSDYVNTVPAASLVDSFLELE